MPFDERLAERIRGSLGRRKGFVEKKMFGGVAFLLNGNMCVGVHKSALIVRLAPEETDAALAQPHTRRFDLTGRPMKGWILVEAAGLKTDAKLSKWVQVAAKYAGALAAK
jgi:TfoX N-terminal domain